MNFQENEQLKPIYYKVYDTMCISIRINTQVSDLDDLVRLLNEMYTFALWCLLLKIVLIARTNRLLKGTDMYRDHTMYCEKTDITFKN
jgi:hypothetical protein